MRNTTLVVSRRVGLVSGVSGESDPRQWTRFYFHLKTDPLPKVGILYFWRSWGWSLQRNNHPVYNTIIDYGTLSDGTCISLASVEWIDGRGARRGVRCCGKTLWLFRRNFSLLSNTSWLRWCSDDLEGQALSDTPFQLTSRENMAVWITRYSKRDKGAYLFQVHTRRDRNDVNHIPK